MATPRVDRHLRIAFVVSTLEVGGLQRAIATIARTLDRDRAEMEVVALRRQTGGSTLMYDELGRAGVTVHDLEITGRAERDPRALAAGVRKLRRLFAARDYDIVDSAVLEADLTSRLATVGLDTRHVTHLINLTYDPRALHHSRARHRWSPAAARAVDRLSGHVTAHFVAITHAVARSAERTLGIPAAKITVVERGVDAARFRYEEPARGPVLRVLSVGRLEPAKDHVTAVRAIAELRQRGVACTLTIAGHGALRADIERTIAEGDLNDCVTIVEPVTAVEELYATHDVMLFPSRWEGLGNAALEAMACGRPVVATDLDVLHEVLGPLGRFAPAGDAMKFADALSDVAAMPSDELMTLSRALRQRAIERFDPAETTGRLVDVYERVMREKAAR